MGVHEIQQGYRWVCLRAEFLAVSGLRSRMSANVLGSLWFMSESFGNTYI